MASISTTSYGDDSFVIATGNEGKRREFEVLLKDLLLPEWTVYDRRGFPEPLEEVEETGTTFVENAILKAMETAAATGCCALADDSGLVVDALDGAPGVWSARFAGEDATDHDNNRLLIERLTGVPEEKRTARYVAVVCLATPDNAVAAELLGRRGMRFSEVEAAIPRRPGQPVRLDGRVVLWFRGTVEGIITDEPAGDKGFGYDPYFFVPHLGKTMAELPMDQKNGISHRAEATRKLVEYLASTGP